MSGNDNTSFMDQRLFTIRDIYDLGFIGSVALDTLTDKYSDVKVKELDEKWNGDDNIRKAILSTKNKSSSLDSFITINGLNKEHDKDFDYCPLIKVYFHTPDNEQDDSFFVVKIDNLQEEEYYNMSEVEAIITSMKCKPVWVGDVYDKPTPTTFEWFEESEIDDE